jgi:hypothetical protein
MECAGSDTALDGSCLAGERFQFFVGPVSVILKRFVTAMQAQIKNTDRPPCLELFSACRMQKQFLPGHIYYVPVR